MNQVYDNHSVLEQHDIKKALTKAGKFRANSVIVTHIGNYPSSYQETSSTLKADQPAFDSGTWLVYDVAANKVKVPAAGNFATGAEGDLLAGLSNNGPTDNTTYDRVIRPAMFQAKEGTVYSFIIKNFTPGVTSIPTDWEVNLLNKTFALSQLASPFRGVDQVIDLSAAVDGAKFSVKEINWALGVAYATLVEY